MIQAIIVLIVFVIMKNRLTSLRVVVICAVVAYGLAFLAAYGGYAVSLTDSTAVDGTIAFAICIAASWLVFRKKIKAGDLARKLADEADAQHDADES